MFGQFITLVTCFSKLNYSQQPRARFAEKCNYEQEMNSRFSVQRSNIWRKASQAIGGSERYAEFHDFFVTPSSCLLWGRPRRQGQPRELQK